jgi:hypothetical protein
MFVIRSVPPIVLVALPLIVCACRDTRGQVERQPVSKYVVTPNVHRQPGSAERQGFATNVIDAVAHNEEEDSYSLIIVGTPEWQKAPKRLLLLQEKVNSYLGFITDGQMKSFFPQSAGKPVKIELHCDRPIDAELTIFTDRMNQALEKYHVPFSARREYPIPLGTGVLTSDGKGHPSSWRGTGR